METIFKITYWDDSGRKKQRKFKTAAGVKRFIERENLYNGCLLKKGYINASGIMEFELLGMVCSEKILERMLNGEFTKGAE